MERGAVFPPHWHSLGEMSKDAVFGRWGRVDEAVGAPVVLVIPPAVVVRFSVFSWIRTSRPGSCD